MALNRRERILLFGTIGLIVVGGSYLMMAPLSSRWHTVGQKLSSQQRELAAIKATIARKPEWQEQYATLGRSLNQAQRFEQTSEVMAKVNEVGTTAGILVQNRQPLSPVERDVYRELPLKYSFEATQESLVKFLFGLQTGSGFMSVEQLSVTAKPDNPSVLRCDIQVRALAAKGDKPAS